VQPHFLQEFIDNPLLILFGLPIPFFPGNSPIQSWRRIWLGGVSVWGFWRECGVMGDHDPCVQSEFGDEAVGFGRGVGEQGTEGDSFCPYQSAGSNH
jgi:hypothetical protein